MKTLDLKSLLIGVLLTMLLVSFMLIAGDSAPRAWEFKNVTTPGSGINPTLSKLGEEGWEIVGYTFSRYPEPGRGSDIHSYVLKRPKQRKWNWKFWK